jgi:hypothetical protein
MTWDDVDRTSINRNWVSYFFLSADFAAAQHIQDVEPLVQRGNGYRFLSGESLKFY